MNKLLTALLVTLALGGAAQAGEMIKMKGKLEGRANHEMLHDDCSNCHVNKNKKAMDDSTCIECHGKPSEIAIDESILPVHEANPHKSVHFGDGASCLACHSEHKQKAPICTDCHRTWFKVM